MTAVPRSRRWIMAALMTTMMLAAMDATIVSTVVPQIVADLGGFSLFTWAFSIYLLTQAVTIPIYGKLADQYGRKPVLLLGISLFILGSTAAASAWDMQSLIVFRGIQGLGAGSIMATVNTLAGDLFSVEERARIQGWLSSVWGVSAITGPAIGGLMVDYGSWRWIFLINLPLGAIALLCIWVFLQENVEKRVHQVDYLGGFFIMLSLGTLIFGLLQGGSSWPWWSWQSLALLLLFVLASGLVFYIERRAAEPIIPGWLWRHRVFAGSNFAMIAMGIITMAPMAYLPTFLQSVHGLGTAAAGFVLAAMSIGWPLASSYSGRLYLRIGFRDTALIGAVLQGCAALLFLALPQNTPIVFLVLDQFIFGLGFGLMSTPLLVGSQSIVGWSQRGVVTSANMFSRYLGQTLGAAIFGAIFNAGLTQHLLHMPQHLAQEIPNDINQLLETLYQPQLSVAAVDYLRSAFFDATSAIYLGIAGFSVLVFACAAITPKRFVNY